MPCERPKGASEEKSGFTSQKLSQKLPKTTKKCGFAPPTPRICKGGECGSCSVIRGFIQIHIGSSIRASSSEDSSQFTSTVTQGLKQGIHFIVNFCWGKQRFAEFVRQIHICTPRVTVRLEKSSDPPQDLPKKLFLRWSREGWCRTKHTSSQNFLMRFFVRSCDFVQCHRRFIVVVLLRAPA